MWAALALVATVLTSFLPICNKRLLREAAPPVVAWAVNAASLPLLAAGTQFFTQCTLQVPLSVSCVWRWPQVDMIFVIALISSSLLNWAATLISTYALDQADASLVTPLLTFNPAFTLLIAWVALGEIPGILPGIGVAIMLVGAYFLDVEEARTGWLAPLLALAQRPGSILAILASGLWGTTTVLEKLAIQHVTPPNGPLVAFAGTLIMTLFLTPNALLAQRRPEVAQSERAETQKRGAGGLRVHLRIFLVAAVIAGIAPLFGFTAIAQGNVGYVTALFKLSSVFTVLWAGMFLKEENLRQRLLGTGIMIAGGVLVAL